MPAKLNPCNRLIMVIEDDQEIREALKEILEGEGYNVLTASNGKEAIDLLRSTADLPRLVLLDMMMPIMDGHEFLNILINDTILAAIPVCIHSANYDLQNVQGSRALLRKPASYDAIIALVQSFCD